MNNLSNDIRLNLVIGLESTEQRIWQNCTSASCRQQNFYRRNGIVFIAWDNSYMILFHSIPIIWVTLAKLKQSQMLEQKQNNQE